jgi:DNA-directed RNA polymerase subunit beta
MLEIRVPGRAPAFDSGDVAVAQADGIVSYVDAERIVVDRTDGDKKEYELQKFMRSNQGTLIHQKPIVDVGVEVTAGDVPADGSATDAGEMALGKNPTDDHQQLSGRQRGARARPIEQRKRRPHC